MKTTFYAILLFLSTQLSAFAQDWNTDLATAQEKASRENKNIVLVFAGSDWCAPCIKLERNILQTQTFLSQAEKKWILLKADFPRLKKNKLPTAQTEQNNRLAASYNTNGYFPFVVLLSPDGKKIGETSYSNQSPESFVQTLNQFDKKSWKDLSSH